MAEEKPPTPQQGHAAVVGEEIDHSICEAFDLADDTLMMAELQGKVIDSYMYKVTGSDGKVAEGLNKVGVEFACREFAKRQEIIRVVGEPNFFRDPLDPEFIIVVVRAQRFAFDIKAGKEIALDNSIGCKRQWSKMNVGIKKTDPQTGKWIWDKDKGRYVIDHYEVKPDPYYVEKALSKAQRNAKASLLPKSFVIEMLKNIKEGKAKSEKAAPKKEKAVPAKTAPAKTPPAKTAPPAQPTAEQKGFDMNVLRNNAIAGLKKLAPTGIQIPILWEHLTGTKKTSEVPEAILKKIAADCNRKDARLQTFAARWMIRVDKEVFFYDPKGMTDAMKAAVRKEFEGDTPTTPPPQGDAGPKPEDEF